MLIQPTRRSSPMLTHKNVLRFTRKILMIDNLSTQENLFFHYKRQVQLHCNTIVAFCISLTQANIFRGLYFWMSWQAQRIVQPELTSHEKGKLIFGGKVFRPTKHPEKHFFKFCVNLKPLRSCIVLFHFTCALGILSNLLIKQLWEQSMLFY